MHSPETKTFVFSDPPGHVTGIAYPAVLLLVVARAGLADVELTVQTLALGVDQELERLETSYTVGLSQAALVAQQLSLRVFFLNFGFQIPEGKKKFARFEINQKSHLI